MMRVSAVIYASYLYLVRKSNAVRATRGMLVKGANTDRRGRAWACLSVCLPACRRVRVPDPFFFHPLSSLSQHAQFCEFMVKRFFLKTTHKTTEGKKAKAT